MAISDEREELARLSALASGQLTEIQRIAGRRNIPEAKVQFPRGYIRTTNETRQLLPIPRGLFDETKIRNICYSLQMVDLLRWIAIRTNLDGMLLSQLIKETICIYGHAIDYMQQAACVKLGLTSKKSRTSFRSLSGMLESNSHISATTRVEIDWIWEIRCREHPDRLSDLETTNYQRTDANRARKAFEQFCEEVKNAIIIAEFEDLD